MNIKWLFFLIFLLFFIVQVNADWQEDGSCQVNTDCVISRQVVNETTGNPISNSNCTITIYSPSNEILTSNARMANGTSGYYNYTISFGVLGKYPSIMTCIQHGAGDYNSTDNADVTFIVSSGQLNYFYIAIFIFILILIILKFVTNDNFFNMFAGILSIIFSIMVYREGIGGFADTFINHSLAFIMFGIGIYLIIYSGYLYIQEGEQ